jgi:hypothetical protein
MAEKTHKEGDRRKRKDDFGRDEFFVYSETLDTWLPQNTYLDMFPISQEEMPQDVGTKERNVGLTQRAGIQGLMQGALGLPAFAGDVVFGAAPIAIRQALGDERGYTEEELTPFTSSLRYGSERLADVLGKPRPVTPGEKRLVDYGGGGISAFSGAALSKLLSRAPAIGEKTAAALKEIGTSPGAQTTAAVGGMAGAEIAPQLAPGADEDVRSALSFGGGLLGAIGGGTAAGLTTGISRAAISPFTKEGRELDVGTLMRNMSLNPEQSIFEMQRGVPSVSGVKPLTADVARDPGLAGLEIGVRSASDASNRIAGQRLGNLQVLRGEMDRLARTAGPEDRTAVTERMKQVRAELTNPMREQAFSAMNKNILPENARTSINLVLGRQLDNILTSDRGAGEGAQSVINWTKGRIDNAILDPKVKGDFFRRLYEIRKDLREKTLAPSTDDQTRTFKSGAPVAEEVIRTIDDILDSAAGGNKAWQSYLENFSQASRRMERIGLLQDIQARSLGTVEDIETRQFLLSAPKMAQVLRSRQAEIDETLTRVQKERLNAIMRDLQAGSSTTAPQVRPPTSGTIKNLTMANFIARTLGGNAAENPAVQTIFRPLQWLAKIPQEQAEELLVDAMLDPKLGALLMQKADPKNVATFADALRDSYRATLYQAPASGLLSGGR